MRKTLEIALLAALAVCSAGTAFAQETAAPIVKYSLNVTQDSLRNPDKNDTFTVILDDSKVHSTFILGCSAGANSWGGLIRKDERCNLAGDGGIKGGGKVLPRVKYAGGFTIEADEDGRTDARSMLVTYLSVGKAVPGNATFGGTMTMMPENLTDAVKDMKAKFLKQLEGEGVEIVDEIDAISFNGLQTPSAGFPSDTGCTWGGSMMFAYATYAWIYDLTATCGLDANRVTYKFQGNMPWVDVEGQEWTAEYVLNLTMPSADANSDESLFMTADADSDLFAAADGISGTIRITESDFAKVKIGDFEDEVATRITAEGEFVGTNVPLDVVRSFAHVQAILSRALYGA